MKFMRMTIVANNIDEAINFLKVYIPIKKNGEWDQAEIVAYENLFDNTDDAFNFLEENYHGDTIHICSAGKNSFAYVYQI